MAQEPAFVLIHSPLVGPVTWAAVAQELVQRGVACVVPSLLDTFENPPYWKRHVEAVRSAVEGRPQVDGLVLVAHSGAGPLLPAIGSAFPACVAAYVFVDAGLPGRDGQSRLDMFAPDEASRFRASAVDGSISAAWRNDAVLRTAGIEDQAQRRAFAAEVPHVPLAVYEEPLPVPGEWPDASCAYIQFSAPYQPATCDARARGWPHRVMQGGHLHMVVEPAGVADALLDLAREMGAW